MTDVITPSKPMTAKQIDKAVSHYRAMLEKHRDKIGSSTVVQKVLGRADYLTDQLAVIRKYVKSQSILKFVATIEVELPFDLDPAAYYTSERGRLFVYGGFNAYGGFDHSGNMVMQAEPLPAGTKFRLNVHEIIAKNGATDAQIRSALGRHIFDPTTVCGMYAAMMSAQPNGEAEGHLLNHDRANLAYTSSLVANVYNTFGGQSWSARSWGRYDSKWRRGSRVFSPQLPLRHFVPRSGTIPWTR